MKTVFAVVRWAAVLPVAFASLIVLDVLFNFIPVFDFGISSRGGFLYGLGTGVLIAGGCLAGGLFVAPARHLWLTRVLSSCLVAFTILALIGTIRAGLWDIHQSGLRQLGAICFGLIIAFWPRQFTEMMDQ